MSTSEWSIFDRLDELEEITLNIMEKTDSAEPRLKDTLITTRGTWMLAFNAYALAFLAGAVDAPNPRALKDAAIDSFQHPELSPKTQEVIEEVLIKACEFIEKAETGK